MAEEIMTEPTDEEWDRRIAEHMEQTKGEQSLPTVSSEDAWLPRNPPHPGRSIRDACFEGMTVGEAASLLGVNRVTLSRVINGRGAISPEMALRMERVGWGTAGAWIRRQGNYDLAQARRRMENVA